MEISLEACGGCQELISLSIILLNLFKFFFATFIAEDGSIQFNLPTLGATTYDYTNARNFVRGTVPLPQHPSPRPHPAGASVYKYRDQYFNGTSAAAPVAAGLLACILQQNRGWTPNELKTNVKNAIPNATNWYKGFAPNGAYDPKWLSAYSSKGLDVKTVYEELHV